MEPGVFRPRGGLMDEFDLERLVNRELKRLPLSRAPRTLLPRVMAAVVAPRVLPWYSRPWLTWPGYLQVLSAALLVALGWGGWLLWTEVPGLVQSANQTAAV